MAANENNKDDIEDQLIFLDFNEKLSSELLNNKVFVRVANLEDKNPLIQVNDMIFKGSYQHSVGSNLFFNKNENHEPTQFPFREATKYKLDFLGMQRKVINCKQMKLPPTTFEIPSCPDNIKFNLNWDYKELLKRFERGTLDLDDLLKGSENENSDATNKNDVEQTQDNVCDDGVSKEPIRDESIITSSDILKADNEHHVDISEIKSIDTPSPNSVDDELLLAYSKLQMLAHTPVKRKTVNQDASSCDPLFKEHYDYRSIECKVLCRPWFSCLQNQTSKSIESYINLERCIFLGLLLPSNIHPRTLTEKEKKVVLSIENFENLDLPARYIVLLSHKTKLDEQVSCNNEEQNRAIDEFGRTPLETISIYERLLSALKSRIEEIGLLSESPNESSESR